MRILLNAEKQGELAQLGGWQKDMARRRYQKGSIRKRGKRNAVWELQWWTDCIQSDGTLGRKRESVILGAVASMTRRQAQKAAEEHLRPLNLGKITPYSSISFRDKPVLLPHQIPAVLAALEEPVRTMVLLAVLTGLRIGEILALRWRDVNFNSGEIRVEQACYRGVIGSPKTKGSRRMLPMPE